MCSSWAKISNQTTSFQEISVLISASCPIALRALPEYPGRKLGIHFDPGDIVTVLTQYRKCYYLHNDGNRYEVHFYQLADGTGWIHDFDLKNPKNRTIQGVPNHTFESPGSVLLTNISTNFIHIQQTLEYPSVHDNERIFLNPNEDVYVSSEFRKLYHIHSDGQRYCIRFYRLCDGTGWIHDFNPQFPRERSLSQEMMEIPLPLLRVIARSSNAEEIAHSSINNVITFLCNQMTHHIYYKTCTVATPWTHPYLGRMILFRQKQSLEDIRQLFTESLSQDSGIDFNQDLELTEENALRYQINKLKEQSDLIARERESLLVSLEFFTRLKAGEKKRLDAKLQYSGEHSSTELSLPSEQLGSLLSIIHKKERIPPSLSSPRKGEIVRTNLSDELNQFILQNWNSQVKVVAITGKCIIFLYYDCSWSSTPGLPPLLMKRLHTRPTHLPHPSYVAAGSMNRCYISFDDGSSEFTASEGFQRIIDQNREKRVKRVAFGRHWNSFFILFDDGTFRYQNIPMELQQFLAQKSTHSSGPLQEIYLGPGGEWFLSMKNTSIAFRATSCAEIAEELEGISDMIFGSHGTFLIRYQQKKENCEQGRI